MKKVKVSFDTWIQLLGMIGVLSGLIFVGLEMRQTQQIALGEQQQTRMQTWIGMVGAFTEAGLDYQDIMTGNITGENDFAYSNLTHQSLWTMENDFIQHKLGLMSENAWQARLVAMEVIYNTCRNRPIFAVRFRMLDPEFVKLITSFTDECPAG
tara:strand:- start:356 stop:817 length:462 start_codon:yes stop_codon:yes gene_type:complete